MSKPSPIAIPDEFYTRWSYSKVDAAACPERLLRAHVLREPPSWQPEVSVLGRVVHELTERYGAHCYHAGKPRDDAAVNELVEQYETASPDAAACFERWAARAEFDWQLVIVEGGSVERRLEMDVGEFGTFSGRLDRVTRDAEAKRVRVRDYKTSWHPKPYDEKKPPLQLLLYGLLVCEEYPDTTEVVLEVEYVRKGIVHEWIVEPPLTWARNHLEGRIRRTIEVAEEAVAQDIMRRLRPSGACSYCDFLPACPIDDLPVVTAPANREEAAEMWALSNALKAKGGAIAASIKAYVKECNSFPEGGDSAKLVDLYPPKYCGPDGQALRVVKGLEIAFLRDAQSAGAKVSSLVSLAGEKVAKAINRHEGEVDLQQHTEEYTPSLTLAAREPEPDPVEGGDDE